MRLSQVLAGEVPNAPIFCINCLNASTVLKLLKHFAQDKHAIIRTDNKTAMAYIIHQGGVCLTWLLELARSLLLWSHESVLHQSSFTFQANRICQQT